MNELAVPNAPALEQVGIKRELVVALALALLLAASLFGLKAVRIDQMRGDTAIFLQTMDNIAAHGQPVSQVFANTQAYIDGGYPMMTAAQIARSPLTAPAGERNVLRFHAYLILYPLALLAKLFSSFGVIFAAFALSFAGLLLVAYLDLRAARLPVLAAVLFCALVVASPAWAQSALYGQFYPDRLFLAAGIAFMVLFARKSTPRSWLIAAAVLCLLINERAAVTAGVFALLYTALYWRGLDRDRKFKLLVGAALIAYGLIVMRFAIVNPEYAGFLPSNLAELSARLHGARFVEMAGLYVLVSSPFLVLALFEWRAAVIAGVLMLPNLLGNIGGAEKLGWITHYHSYDFPALVWAASAGYAAAFRLAPIAQRRGVFYAVTAALAVFLVLLDPMSFDRVHLAPSQASSSFFAAFPRDVAADFSPSGMKFRDVGNRLQQSIPEGAVVTTVEGGMPSLYRGRTIRLFPMGVDEADYAVVGDAGVVNGKHRYIGTVNFLGPQETSRIDDVIMARMRKDGYDFAHALAIPEFGLAVIQRSAASRKTETSTR